MWGEGEAILVCFLVLMRLLGQKRWNKADEPWQLFSAFFSKLQIYATHSNSYMACSTGTIFESKGKFHLRGKA